MVKIKLFGAVIDVPSINGDDEELELGVPLYNPTPLQFRLPQNMATRKRRKSNVGAPAIPLQLLQNMATTQPIFLYQKKLDDSDVNREQNRLLVITREGFDEFLNYGECAILNDGTKRGLEDIGGIDAQGNKYKLRLNIWSIMNIMVISSDWYKLVKQNDARKGDWVQIWGHRDHMGKLCFAIHFNNKKPCCC